jgi:glutamate dehydrogenase
MITTSSCGVVLPAGYIGEAERYPEVDTATLDLLAADGFEFRIRRGDNGQLRVTLYTAEGTVSLERVLSLLASCDLDVVSQVAMTIRRPDALLCTVHEFEAEPKHEPAVNLWNDDSTYRPMTAAMSAMWAGWVEVDRLAVLTVSAGLSWQDTALLRAYGRFLRHTVVPLSQNRIHAVLLSHPEVSAALVELFHRQFDPALCSSDDVRAKRVDQQLARVKEQLEQVSGLDAHRTLNAYLTLISATSRTNYYLSGGLGPDRNHISLKFRSEEIEELPRPRPPREIFVYSPEVEGVHIRFGQIARGGVRWSDRLDDYRTEVLGLAKAQSVKNAVIVPAGAKGGFVVRRPPSPTGNLQADHRAHEQAGRRCYRQFITGLLEITDNLSADGEPSHPGDVVCRDGFDPYLVVAADKGTATFADVANEIAAEHEYWLGDAFASGGSVGYDHKKMGITAKGAWVSVRRHLSEMEIDVDRDSFAVAGIGDMSGDVFGNAMLLSRSLALVAAFDHRHVLIDPAPDVERSWHERRRLFELPGSSWADYAPHAISAGGGVWPRDIKSIPVSDQMRAVLGLGPEVSVLTPPAMIQAILSAPVDLLFNGGIGTYVKSSGESHLAAGDKANDIVRVDANALRCRVIAEGGNLGLTSLARIEYARSGGRINTDALDNSAGVDCSDREVNIKILLGGAIQDGPGASSDRSQFLASLTDEVSRLVLRDNAGQNRLLGEARSHAHLQIDVHGRMINDLVARRGLDRELEALPGPEELGVLAAEGKGLTSPELATLLAHAKLDLKAGLTQCGAFAGPVFSDLMAGNFPVRLADVVAVDVHPLRNEILATELVNDIFEMGGITYAHRLWEETGATPEDILRAFVVVTEVFDIRQLWDDIVAEQARPAVEYSMIAEVRRLLDRASRWFLANRQQPLAVDAEIARFRDHIRKHSGLVSDLLCGNELAAMRLIREEFVTKGIGDSTAKRLADGLYRYSLLDIIEVASETGLTVEMVASTYFTLSDRLDIDRWLIAVSALPRRDRWHTLARLTLREDLYRSVRLLTRDVVTEAAVGGNADRLIAEWERDNWAHVQRAGARLEELAGKASHDVASLSVAARYVRSMANLS